MSPISIAIVTHHPDLGVLKEVLQALERAVATFQEGGAERPVTINIADNSTDQTAFQAIAALAATQPRLAIQVEPMPTNLGYGRAHNHCLRKVASKYHLVLNPDVLMDSDALREAVRYMDRQPDVGLLTPRVSDETGAQSYLAKRRPGVADLVLRGFAPQFIRQRFSERLNRYEMRDSISDKPVLDVPIASGCFMFFSTAVLQQVGGFDPRYFMYFEDFDLCMRLHGVARIDYVPLVHITHFGGGAAKKGWRHIRMFGVSAFRFFHRWGWKWN